jgi:hypothetical protein
MKWTGHRPTIYRSSGIREGFKDLVLHLPIFLSKLKKLEIPMFDGQVNVEVLNRLVETNGSLFWPLSNPRNTIDLFFTFEDDGHALLWWESYVDALRIGKNPMIMKWEDFKDC